MSITAVFHVPNKTKQMSIKATAEQMPTAHDFFAPTPETNEKRLTRDAEKSNIAEKLKDLSERACSG